MCAPPRGKHCEQFPDQKIRFTACVSIFTANSMVLVVLVVIVVLVSAEKKDKTKESDFLTTVRLLQRHVGKKAQHFSLLKVFKVFLKEHFPF